MILTLLAIAVALMLLLWGIGKIPLSYNLRNLTVRWKTTLMTLQNAPIANSPRIMPKKKGMA